MSRDERHTIPDARPGGTKVLHVVESFGGGVRSALTQYVLSTPELEHHLVRRLREADAFVPEDDSRLFASIHEFPASFVGCLRAVPRVMRQVHPTIVHAHSSWAGVFARLTLSKSRHLRVVYTPHCFAFERTDVSKAKRLFFWVAEVLLALNTSVIAGCSAGEARRAGRWPTCGRSIYVPNVAPRVERVAKRERGSSSSLVAVGRLSIQKDPSFFLDTVRALRARGHAVRAIWVGDGDNYLADQLRAGGVEVTGWVSTSEVLTIVASATAYVHPASWEGFPMSVLEAVAAGTPVVARRIAAFEEGPMEWIAASPVALAARLESLIDDPDAGSATRNVESWRIYLAESTREIQRSRLMESYFDLHVN